MAPEVLRGGEVTAKADVYSFAMCLWEIITGDELYPNLEDIPKFR